MYRAGILSLQGICHQYKEDHKYSQTWKKEVSHGIISKHAKDYKWTRDLSGKIKARIEEQLIKKPDVEHEKKKRISDRDIIEQAATAGSNIILRHRREIVALAIREDALLIELDGVGIDKKKAPSLKDKSLILKNIAAVRTQRITLERQAHNLNTFETQPPAPVNDIESLEMELRRRGIPLPVVDTIKYTSSDLNSIDTSTGNNNEAIISELETDRELLKVKLQKSKKEIEVLKQLEEEKVVSPFGAK